MRSLCKIYRNNSMYNPNWNWRLSEIKLWTTGWETLVITIYAMIPSQLVLYYLVHYTQICNNGWRGVSLNLPVKRILVDAFCFYFKYIDLLCTLLHTGIVFSLHWNGIQISLIFHVFPLLKLVEQ